VHFYKLPGEITSRLPREFSCCGAIEMRAWEAEDRPVVLAIESKTRDRNPGASRVNLSARALVVGALSFLGASCRSTEPTTVPYSPTAVRLELPFVRQEAENDCGLASVSALCRYWHVAIPDAEFDALAQRADEAGGLAGGELQATLERLGFEVYLFQGSLDRSTTGLYGHVDTRRPPLVMLATEGNEPHYEIVLGYDEPRAGLILLDPVRGEVLVSTADFERDWARCNRFTLLASRGRDAFASAEQADETRKALGQEKTP
jgi:hypothetical protein